MWEECFCEISRIAEEISNEKPPAEIPKIIFQTYKSEAQLPPHWKHTPTSWRESHPGYEYLFYSDQRCRDLIEVHFPWFLKVYDSYPYFIQKVDAFRPFALFHHGGWYIDMDIQNKPGKTIDDLRFAVTPETTKRAISDPTAYCLHDPMGFLMDEHAPLTSNFQDRIFPDKKSAPSRLLYNVREQQQHLRLSESGTGDKSSNSNSNSNSNSASPVTEKVTNCFMGSKPRSAFMLLVIFEICARSMIASASILVSRCWWMLQREWTVLHTTGPGAWTEALRIHTKYIQGMQMIRKEEAAVSAAGSRDEASQDEQKQELEQDEEQKQKQEQEQEQDRCNVQEEARARYFLHLISLDLNVQKQKAKLKLQDILASASQSGGALATISPEVQKRLQATEKDLRCRTAFPNALRKAIIKHCEREKIVTIPSYYIAPAICTFFSNYRPCTVKTSFAVQLEGLSWVSSKTTKNLTHIILEAMFWLQVRRQKSLYNRVLRELQQFERAPAVSYASSYSHPVQPRDAHSGGEETETFVTTQKEKGTQVCHIRNVMAFFDRMTTKLEGKVLRSLHLMERQMGNPINSWMNNIRRRLLGLQAQWAKAIGVKTAEDYSLIIGIGIAVLVLLGAVVGLTIFLLWRRAIRRRNVLHLAQTASSGKD